MDATILINQAHPLPVDFRPDGLIDLYSLENRHFFIPLRQMLLDSSAAQALNRMCADAGAEENLTDFYIASAWRSRGEQSSRYAADRTGVTSVPGCSEHEAGLAIDIGALSREEEGLYLSWLEKNSWRYGFIPRYPSGGERITRHCSEPGHYRYVGERPAALLHESRQTWEEYHDPSLQPADPYDPAYIFMDIFGPGMKGHWQTWPDIDLKALREVNPAAVGWIHMEGTAIDYPVVGPELDSSWCLLHNFSGEPSCHGLIRLSGLPGNGDCSLSGHNMIDGTMFKALNILREAGNFDAHPCLELNLMGTRYTARWFAALVVDNDEDIPMPPPSNRAERAEWLRRICGDSCCTAQTMAAPEDRILVCQTCADYPSTRQTVLYAALQPAQQETGLQRS